MTLNLGREQSFCDRISASSSLRKFSSVDTIILHLHDLRRYRNHYDFTTWSSTMTHTLLPRLLILTFAISFLFSHFISFTQAKVILHTSGSTFSSFANQNLKTIYTNDDSHPNSMEYNEQLDSMNAFQKLMTTDVVMSDVNIPQVFSNGVYHSQPLPINGTSCVQNMFGVLVWCVHSQFSTTTISQINLSLDTLVQIYDGTVRYWNDSRIKSENPSLASQLPFTEIKVLSRSGSSGTSFNVLNYLARVNSDFENKYQILSKPTFNMRQVLNVTNIMVDIPTNREMIRYVNSMEGALGYTSLNAYDNMPSTQKSKVVLVNVLVNGISISPNVENVKSTISKYDSKILTSSSIFSQSLKIAQSTSSSSLYYPFITFTYWCVKTSYSITEEGAAILQFILNSYRVMDSEFKVTISQSSSTLNDDDMIITSLTWNTAQTHFSMKKNQLEDVLYMSGTFAIMTALSSTNFKTLSAVMMCENKKCSSFLQNISTPATSPFELFLYIAIPIISVLVLSIVVIVIGIISYCMVKRRNLKTPSQLNQQLLDDFEPHQQDSASTYTYTPKLFEYDQLKSTIKAEELTLDEQIGSGSFSEVYKGRWLGAMVAVKRFMINHHVESEEVIQDFIKESKLMSKLRHPNVVQFLGVCVQMPHLYMVTEFCERGNLQHILKDKKIKLSLRKTISLALDAARGMFYLHSNNPPIVHRDFKSANLLVDKNWSVKVADFGMSRILDSQQQMTVCGTAETCAPEVLKRSMYTEKADVYSYGIVLWELFTRGQLYPGLGFYELSSRVVNEGLRPDLTGPRFTEGHIPKEIVNIMTQCWDEDPNVRPDFGRIVEVLEEQLEIELERSEKSK
ncbi:hypothetical protein C9374_013999 [Naegleria lovaniensis]|uniref:Protein kinase domain-containing protein n=1 Tax=Naegleria lovaniensis TaxID=51637 RepID=A0AA88KPR8_NAELO|nr:uncharacterized protein C9374_013999 [Naegleria lovaniensis]KAG2389439.1 hypothetical protein C9374_013999 [Naegleria lovaniensis]